MVQGVSVVYTAQVTAVSSQRSDTAVAARLLCIDTTTAPHLVIGAEAALGAAEFATSLELSECSSISAAAAAWACDDSIACDVSAHVFSEADLL